jgi:hypothetical protein
MYYVILAGLGFKLLPNTNFGKFKEINPAP